MINLKALLLIAFLTVLPQSDRSFNPSDTAKQLKEARDYMMYVAEKMPEWDADYVGRFERKEIETVKSDIFAASQAPSVDDFLIDIQQLRDDAAALIALDEALNKERVI